MRTNKLLAGTLLLLTVQNAFALNLQGYRFSDSYRYSLLDDSFQEKFPGRFVGTLSYGYVNSPFYYSDSYLHHKDKNIINGNNVFTAGFTYYLNNKVTLGLDLNAVHNTTFGDTRTTLADSVIKSKINLMRKETFSLSLNPQIFIPTGKTDNFSSMNSVGGALSVVAEKSFNRRLHFLASVGGLSAKNNQYVDVDHRQLLLTQFGVSLDVTEKLNVNFESWRNFPLVQDTLQDEGKYFLTAKHKTHKNFSTYIGAGVAGFSNVNNDTYSAFVGIKFHDPEAPAQVAQVVTAAAAAPVRSAPSTDVYFGHDKDSISDNQLETLQDYINYLNSVGAKKVVLEGHASAVGPAPYNMKLSKRRAENVKKYLVNHGLEAKHLTVKPFGETAPQDPEEGKNRRVHFQVEK